MYIVNLIRWYRFNALALYDRIIIQVLALSY